MRILIVENNPEWQNSIRRGLPAYEVDVAPSYDEALARLDVGPEYALAIVDLNLNDSDTDAYNRLDMLGGDVLEHLLENYPNTRRIALTAFPPVAVRDIFEQYEIDDLLFKQRLTIADLRKAVRAALERARPDTPPDV